MAGALHCVRTRQEDKAVVNGAHDSAALQTLMNGFVSRFVLCPKCSLPETTLVSGAVSRREGGCALKLSDVSSLGVPLAVVVADRQAAFTKDFPQVCRVWCQGAAPGGGYGRGR